MKGIAKKDIAAFRREANICEFVHYGEVYLCAGFRGNYYEGEFYEDDKIKWTKVSRSTLRGNVADFLDDRIGFLEVEGIYDYE